VPGRVAVVQRVVVAVGVRVGVDRRGRCVLLGVGAGEGAGAGVVPAGGCVDEAGRPTSVTDGNNQTTGTAYSPATGAEPTLVTVTDPLKMQTKTTYDPTRDLAMTATTPAGYVTSSQYDALGRVTALFKPGRPTNGPPDLKYEYQVHSDAPSLVSTYTLTSSFEQTEQLYDAMMRVRETQTQAAGSGRIQSDVFYNDDGWKSGATDEYYNAADIGTAIEPAQDGKIDSETAYTYDGAGRKTADIAYTLGDETWRTTYSYGGNFVTKTPPAGAPATTTVTDARGNTVRERRYHAGVTPDYLHAATGTYDDTAYTYTAAGKVATETDQAGNGWSWTYDQLGETTSTTDPDTGQLTTAYDNKGAPITLTDAENRQTTTKFDADGRKTGIYDTTNGAASAANQLSGWTYDTVKKGPAGHRVLRLRRRHLHRQHPRLQPVRPGPGAQSHHHRAGRRAAAGRWLHDHPPVRGQRHAGRREHAGRGRPAAGEHRLHLRRGRRADRADRQDHLCQRRRLQRGGTARALHAVGRDCGTATRSSVTTSRPRRSPM
jgi:YD repeat-containing protein